VLVLFGSWKTLPWFVVVGAWGALVIGAIYMLRAVRDVWHGEAIETAPVQDASAWRKVPFVLLLAALIVVGVWPRLLTDKIEPSVKRTLATSTPPAVALTK
jgi:NADH-quinone oxidoreductase subunit M